MSLELQVCLSEGWVLWTLGGDGWSESLVWITSAPQCSRSCLAQLSVTMCVLGALLLGNMTPQHQHLIQRDPVAMAPRLGLVFTDFHSFLFPSPSSRLTFPPGAVSPAGDCERLTNAGGITMCPGWNTHPPQQRRPPRTPPRMSLG